jgi:hypothetical protein
VGDEETDTEGGKVEWRSGLGKARCTPLDFSKVVKGESEEFVAND